MVGQETWFTLTSYFDSVKSLHLARTSFSVTFILSHQASITMNTYWIFNNNIKLAPLFEIIPHFFTLTFEAKLQPSARLWCPSVVRVSTKMCHKGSENVSCPPSCPARDTCWPFLPTQIAAPVETHMACGTFLKNCRQLWWISCSCFEQRMLGLILWAVTLVS